MVQANPAEVVTPASEAGHVSAQTIARRLDLVRERIGELGLDSLLVTQPYNREYLSGFTGEDQPPLDTAGFLLVTKDDVCLITDGRYTIQASRELPSDLGFKVAVRSGKLAPIVADQIAKRSLKRVGFETAHLIHMWWRAIDKALPDTDLVPTTRVVEPLRIVKDEDELAIIRRAISISDRAFDEVAARIQPGMTERQVAWEIEKTMRDLGADDKAFGTILAAGPNGAMAHAVPSDRPIKEGEPIVVDMGARYKGYNSDMTRTLVLGEPDDKFREIYNLVFDAHMAAERRLRAGASGADGDAYARQVIEAAGYGERFNHGLGHGIGLEVHEGPSLSRISEDIVPENAVTSVEPGVYIEGWGGVRIEDLVLFRPDDVEVLTQASKHGKY